MLSLFSFHYSLLWAKALITDKLISVKQSLLGRFPDRSAVQLQCTAVHTVDTLQSIQYACSKDCAYTEETLQNAVCTVHTPCGLFTIQCAPQAHCTTAVLLYLQCEYIKYTVKCKKCTVGTLHNCAVQCTCSVLIFSCLPQLHNSTSGTYTSNTLQTPYSILQTACSPCTVRHCSITAAALYIYSTSVWVTNFTEKNACRLV